MKTQSKKKPLKLYDVAAGPMYLIIFGVPLAILLAVVGLVFFAGKLIGKARARNQQTLDARTGPVDPSKPDQAGKEN